MKKWLLISSLLVVSPIFSMSRALRRGASLARRPIARRSSTLVSQIAQTNNKRDLLAAGGWLGLLILPYASAKYHGKQMHPLTKHPQLQTSFTWTVSKASLEVIQKVLEDDTSDTLVNATDQFGNSALAVACIRGNAEIVQALLDKGADVKADSTPLIVALLKNNATIVEMLIEKGANIEKIRYKNYGGLGHALVGKNIVLLWQTLSHYGARRYSPVREFLEDRADGCTPYGIGKKADYTPLTVAVAWASPDIVQLLIDNGADIEAPILRTFVVNRGNPEILKVLLANGLDIEAKRSFLGLTNPSLLVLAARESHYRESVEIARTLLEHGANPNVQDKNGKTPLMLASRCRDWTVGRNGSVSSIPPFGEKSFLSMVDVLAKYGADVNTRDKGGMTPLMWASLRGHVTMVDALVAHGADVNVRDQDGMTPLMWASSRGHVTVVEALVARGADIEAIDNNELTARNWALRKGRIKIVEILAAHSADLQSTSVSELT